MVRQEVDMEEYKVMAEYIENGSVKTIGPFETEEDAWKKLDKLAKKSDNREEFEKHCFVVLEKK